MRSGWRVLATFGLMLLAASRADAQAVQLPTFRYFSVQTTVSVPDRGGVVMGGVNRASSGTTSRGFGPLRNRASGSSVGASSVSVHATIIDHNELDEAVLAEARRRRGEDPLVLRPGAASSLASDDPTARRSAYLSRHVATRDEQAPERAVASESSPDSLEELRAKAAARQAAKHAEAAEKLAAGIAAQEAGKFASARGYYEAAMRIGDDQVRAQAAERMAAIALPAPKNRQVADR